MSRLSQASFCYTAFCPAQSRPALLKRAASKVQFHSPSEQLRCNEGVLRIDPAAHFYPNYPDALIDLTISGSDLSYLAKWSPLIILKHEISSHFLCLHELGRIRLVLF